MAVKTMTYLESIQDFLDQPRVAVCGLSRTKDSGAGAIYLKLRANGYHTFAVHPSAETLHGDKCYASLSAIPGGVDAVFIMNSPDISEKLVDEALALGIKRIWMHHNGMMASSVSPAAVEKCRKAGINVISAGCPMMFLHPDFFHKFMRWTLRVRGQLN